MHDECCEPSSLFGVAECPNGQQSPSASAASLATQNAPGAASIKHGTERKKKKKELMGGNKKLDQSGNQRESGCLPDTSTLQTTFPSASVASEDG